jgi:deazaflavin-dependent oxidoreductase (nitroreductase family)
VRRFSAAFTPAHPNLSPTNKISRVQFSPRSRSFLQRSTQRYNAEKPNEAGANMPPHNTTLKAQLARHQEITITVIGRKSGRAISIPVWFVLEDSTLYLLPVQGSDTQWFKNVQAKPSIKIAAGDAHAELKPIVTPDAKQVASVVEKFRARYGAGDVKKYYSKFDVAVLAQLT